MRSLSAILTAVTMIAVIFFAAAPGKSQAGTIGGLYQVTGTNPNGSSYQGTVFIEKKGSTYAFTWNVGNSYTGVGVLAGNVMTVQWGDDYPVIYQVLDGGRVLEGTWANGQATETLTKSGD